MVKKLMDKSPVRAKSPGKESSSKSKSFGKKAKGSRTTMGKADSKADKIVVGLINLSHPFKF